MAKAKTLVKLRGPDGQIILAESGGAAYQRLISKGFVDTTQNESPLAEFLLECAVEGVDSASELSEIVQDDAGEFKVMKRRGRGRKPKTEYVKDEE